MPVVKDVKGQFSPGFNCKNLKDFIGNMNDNQFVRLKGESPKSNICTDSVKMGGKKTAFRIDNQGACVSKPGYQDIQVQTGCFSVAGIFLSRNCNSREDAIRGLKDSLADSFWYRVD